MKSDENPNKKEREAKKIKWLTTPATNFSKHASIWDQINDANQRSPFLTSKFIQVLIETYGDQYVNIAYASIDERIVALALLQRYGLSKWGFFQPSQLMIAPLISTNEISIDKIAISLAQSLPSSTLLLSLTQLDPDLYPRPSDSATLCCIDYIETCSIEISTRNFSQYENSLSKNLLSNIRKRARKAEIELGPLSLRCYTDRSHIDEFLTKYATTESKGWKSKTGTALKPHDHQFQFYRQLLLELSEEKEAYLFELSYGEHCAALEIVIIHLETAIFLKTTHDENLRTYAPGQRLFYEIIRWLTQNEPAVRKIETYGPLNEKQRAFATSIKLMYHINSYRSSLFGALHRTRLQNSKNNDTISANETIAIKKSRSTSFFGSSEWFRLLNDTTITDGELIESKSEDRLVLPLVYSRHPASGSRMIKSHSNFYTGVFHPIHSSSSTSTDLEAAITAVLSERKWDLLEISPIHNNDSSYHALCHAFRKLKISYDTFYRATNWYVPIGEGGYSNYLQHRPSRLINTLRRSKKRFLNSGGSFEVLRKTGPELESAVHAFNKLYLKRGRRPEPFPQFIPELCRRAANRGELLLGLASISGVTVAAQIWILHDHTAMIFKLAHDPAYGKMSVGSLLTAYLFEEAIDRDRVTQVDFLSGNEEYKKDWMLYKRDLVGIIVFNRDTFLGRMHEHIHKTRKYIRTLLTLLRERTH